MQQQRIPPAIYTMLIVLFLWASPAWADTYYYDVNTNNTNDAAYAIKQVASLSDTSFVSVDANTSGGHPSLRQASLFVSSVGGAWAAGDTVYLRAGKVFRSDPPASDLGLVLLDANTDGTGSVGWDANSNWFTLNLAGGEIWYHAASAGLDAAAVRIAESGYAVMNGVIRTTDANGGRVFAVGGPSDGGQGSVLSANIQDFLVRDIVGVALPYVNSSPTAIRQDVETSITAGEYNITGRVERFTFENGLGFRDILTTSGASTTIARGYMEFIDCRVGGATSTGGSGNGTGNGCLSADATALHVVYGGVYHDAGGSCIEQVPATASPGCATEVYGVEVYNSQYRENFDNGGTGYTASNAGIYASWAENCYIHHCPTGVRLISNDASSGSNDEHDIATVRNCLIVAHPTEGRTSGDISVTSGGTAGGPAGVAVSAPNARVEDTWVFDFDYVDTTTNGQHQAAIRQVGGNQFLQVSRCWIKNMFRGVEFTITQDSGAIIEDSVFSGELKDKDVNSLGNGAAVYALSGSGSRITALLRDNVFALDPNGTVGSFIVAAGSSTTQSTGSRGNYYWCADDNTNGVADCASNGFRVWTPDTTDDASTNSTSAHFGANTRPILDDYGRVVASAIDSNTDGTPEASPGLTTAFATPIPLSTWNGNRIATGAAGTVTSAGQFITTLASATDDFYNGQTLYCTAATTAGNVGEYRRIVDYIGATKEIFVEPRFSGTVTAATDSFVVLPPMDPPWGDLGQNKLGVLRYEMQTEQRDMFGRYPLPTSPSVLPRGQITGRRVGGPNKLRRVPTDYRWRGQSPLLSGEEKGNVQAVLPDPGGTPTGGFGGSPGRFHAAGND